MIELDILRCVVLDAPADWPALQVLEVVHPHADTDGHEAHRRAARLRIREALRRSAAPAIAEPFLDDSVDPLTARGAKPVSISHASGASLVAWCERGCVGIDIVDWPVVPVIEQKDLEATAALYLGPEAARMLRLDTAPLDANRRFAHAWAQHEARLKCLGMALEEWTPALAAELTRCATAEVRCGPSISGLDTPWLAHIAWREAER